MTPQPAVQFTPPPAALDPQAVYLSPQGRRCRLCTSEAGRPRNDYATMVYDRSDGGPGVGALADSFVLARANWHLLRRLA